MIKIYTLKRLRACRLTCTDGSVSVTLNFEPSYGTQRSANGKVVISDPNIQAVIESDPKFGRVFELTGSYEEKKVTTVTNMRGDLCIMQPMAGKKRRTQAQIDAEKEAVKESAKKPAKGGKKASNVKPVETPVEETDGPLEQGMVFADVNEAFAYFAEKGEQCTSEEELVELMNKYGASFAEEE